MLCGELAVLQAPMFDGLSLDPFALFDDGRSPAEVGVGGRHVVQALVVAILVVVLDERLDLGLEVAGQEVVLQQDAVLQGLVPAFDLAPRSARTDHRPCGGRCPVSPEGSPPRARPARRTHARVPRPAGPASRAAPRAGPTRGRAVRHRWPAASASRAWTGRRRCRPARSARSRRGQRPPAPEGSPSSDSQGAA